MTFVASTTPDITEALPFLLSARKATEIASSQGTAFDIAIAGIGFRLGAAMHMPYRNDPYSVESVTVQKQQIDTSKEAGEQSLDGFWTRSQTSWHKGSGLTYYEPGSEDTTSFRFADSTGINPWTRDQVSALPGVVQDFAQAGTVWVYNRDTSGGVVYAQPTGLITGGLSSAYTHTDGGTSYDVRPYVFGPNVAVQLGTGGVWNAKSAANIATSTSGSPNAAFFVKSRLIVAKGASLFEVPLSGSAVNLDTPATTALWTHPSSTFTWVAVVETPSAILAFGNDGLQGSAYRFALENATSGTTPKLSQAYPVGALPGGEYITDAYAYLGQFVGLATETASGHHIRIAAVNTDSSLVYGPILVDSGGGPIAGYGDYLYFACPSQVPTPGGSPASGLLRVNLGEPIGSVNDLQFAYAWDINTGTTGTITSIAFDATGKPVVAVTGLGFYKCSGMVASGYLKSGKIRFASAIPKIFRFLDLQGQTNGSSIRVTVTTANGALALDYVMNDTTGLGRLGLDTTVQSEWVQITFTFTGGNPVLQSMFLSAVPKPRRNYIYTYPLHLRDEDEDRNGFRFGSPNFTYQRLQALMEMQDQRLGAVLIQDFRTGESYTGIIEDLKFTNYVNPDGPRANFGGMANVAIRKLT